MEMVAIINLCMLHFLHGPIIPYQGEYKDHEAMEYIVKDDETMEYNQESKYFPVRRFLKRMSRR
jgi:hypothetical protein